MSDTAIDRLVASLYKRSECDLKIQNVEANVGCIDGKIIGTGRSDYTTGAHVYDLEVDNKNFSLIDIPGIEGDESSYEDIIKRALEKAHTIFYVNGSGKKIEKNSLEKIKKYMRDGTSVYAVFNVHCKAKKKRIPGIDKSFSDELILAFSKQLEIIDQTEVELRDFLGDNFKGSISINGLMAFCALAINNDNATTIVCDKEKNLRGDQEKYIKEYAGDVELLRKESRIADIQEEITKHTRNFENEIYDENIKKLKSRTRTMIDKIKLMKKHQKQLMDDYVAVYDEYIDRCEQAKADYLRIMNNAAVDAASVGFYELMDILFEKIESDEGKTKKEELQQIIDTNEAIVTKTIQDNLNKRIDKAQKEFNASLKDAYKRMSKDLDRAHVSLRVSVLSESIKLDDSVIGALHYDAKSFTKDTGRVAGLALSGAGVGSIFNLGIGTAIGAVAGALLGIVLSIINFFIGKEKRINKAKANIRSGIDDMIQDVASNINAELLKQNYKESADAVIDDITESINRQKNAIHTINKALSTVEKQLNKSYLTI